MSLRGDHLFRSLRSSLRPTMGRLLRFFPPEVTGTVLLVIGISLMRVEIDWSAGGHPMLADGSPNPDYGKPIYLAISPLQLILILGIQPLHTIIHCRYRGAVGSIGWLLRSVLTSLCYRVQQHLISR